MFARDAGETLDLRVPALDAVFKVRRQNADVDRFDDVLAELLQPLVLLDLGGEAAIEAGVLDGDGDVAGE